jgi:hypothetical protein
MVARVYVALLIEGISLSLLLLGVWLIPLGLSILASILCLAGAIVITYRLREKHFVSTRILTLTSITLAAVIISPLALFGTHGYSWTPGCLNASLFGTGGINRSQVYRNQVTIGFWNDESSNAHYVSSKYGAPVVYENSVLQFAVFQPANFDGFLRSAMCEPVAMYAEPNYVVSYARQIW